MSSGWLLLLGLGLMPALWSLRSRNRSASKTSRVSEHHCVTIKSRAGACQAAVALKGKRFLSDEAPAFPLPECDAEQCGAGMSITKIAATMSVAIRTWVFRMRLTPVPIGGPIGGDDVPTIYEGRLCSTISRLLVSEDRSLLQYDEESFRRSGLARELTARNQGQEIRGRTQLPLI
jgi:hypothetical protein